ncbi:hypothetical protein ACROYT_G012698 [Oculina patagonica]
MNPTLGTTDYSDLAHSVPCKQASEHDRNTTVSASQVIAASGTALFYLVIFFLSIFGVCFKPCAKLTCSHGTFFSFLVGVLIASVNVFTNADDLQVKLYCRIFTMFLIGIVFALFGAALFFKRPEGLQANLPTLGRQQPSMGLVVSSITIPLVVIEIVLLIAAAASKKTDEPAGMLKYRPWIFVLVDKSTFLVQKIIQVIIYMYLRNTIICPEYEENAQFYFRALAFFNLIEWVDSQVNADSDVRLSGIGKEFDGWFTFVTELYTALIIDYRLLCSLLFLEHSMEIETEGHEIAANGAAGNIERPSVSNMTPCDRQIRTIGYIVGFCCLIIAPLFCGLYYVPNFHLKSWVNVFAIIVNSAVVVCGTCLLCSNDLDDGGIKESHAVKIMVCCMGAVGFTCWMMKALIACYWAATVHDRSDVGADPSYPRWDAPKFIVRSVTTAFLMGLFMKVNARAFSQRNPTRRINHFLIPAIMLALLSMFAESLIDQYLGLEEILRCEIEEQSMKILFEAGSPMYLGFLLHVCLHFVIIQASIGKSDNRSSRSSTISEYLDAEDINPE